MDLSPHSGHSDASEDETVGFEQDVQHGPFKKEDQEIECEEGPPKQESFLYGLL
jgi:hypothetical protein